MLIRDKTPPPYRVTYSDLFEVAFYRAQVKFPSIDDMFWNLENEMQQNPLLGVKSGLTYPCGAFMTNAPDRNFYLNKTTPTFDRPSFRVLFELSPDHVHCWSLSEAERLVYM